MMTKERMSNTQAERGMKAQDEPVIDTYRLAELQAVSLKSGCHQADDREFCVMEAVAYVAGEPWSDAPACACPVISAFMRSWNDSLTSDAERDRLLKPLVIELVGTRSTKAAEERRSYMALDWLIRVHTPKWLDMVPSLHAEAKALRELDAIVDMAGATAAGVKVRAAWAAAWAAARAAAGAAAGDAAGAAAWAVAGAAAGAAAWAAAGDAAGYAAGYALKPTAEWLQASATDLVRQMIAVGAEAAYQYPLPDSLYPGSKDWIAADYAGRVEWLHYCYESVRRNLENLETQLTAGNAPANVPSETTVSTIVSLAYDFHLVLRHIERVCDRGDVEAAARSAKTELAKDVRAALAAQPRSTT